LATSPFQPDPEPTIEQYAINDKVSHDTYGMGRVIQVEALAVTVDFRPQMVASRALSTRWHGSETKPAAR
jgi:hypothetical protein